MWLENAGWTKEPVLLRVTCPPLRCRSISNVKNGGHVIGKKRGFLCPPYVLFTNVLARKSVDKAQRVHQPDLMGKR